MRKNLFTTLAFLLLLAAATNLPAAEKSAAYQTAIDSIVAAEMFQTVDDLASPKFEGREAGSTGGRAAGDYLVQQLRKLPLQPAGKKQGYFQPFGNGYRNILALLPGSDPNSRSDDCRRRPLRSSWPRPTSRQQPAGNDLSGADDNASGTSGILELARAFSAMPIAPRRSILFVCFDGEEKGLLGSKHWTANPTLPLSHVKFMLNLDMIGSLRAERVLVFGSRTACGLRRMASLSNQLDAGLTLDFSWLMTGNADHYAFYDHGIPTLFLHTDLHERYHRPTDVAAKINREGMMQVARLAFAILYEMAEGPLPPHFRPLAKAEKEDARRRLEAAEPIAQRPGDPPMRLGIAWRTDDAEPDTVIVSHVAAASAAAAAGLRVGDRIYRVGGRDFADDTAFARLARSLPGPLELLVERDGRLRTVVLHFPGEGQKAG